MINKSKKYFSQIAYAASKGIYLPYTLTLIIQIISNIEIISLILSETILSKQKDDDYLTQSIADVFSSVKSIIMLSKIDSEILSRIVAYTCYLYISSNIVLLVYVAIRVFRHKEIHPQALKIFPFTSLVHSQIMFYPIHCFLLRMVKLYLNCNTSSRTLFYCDTEWIILPILFTFLNITLSLFKQIYGYQIRNKKNAYAIKDNLYLLTIFIQKLTVIPFLYFVVNHAEVIIILNILFCSLGLYFLQARLPFYNLGLLRLEASFSSVALLFSLFMIPYLFNYQRYILVTMIAITPLAIKSSLLILKRTLTKILTIKYKDPLKVTHLPMLVEVYMQPSKSLLQQKQSSEGTLLICGYCKEHKRNFKGDILEENKSQAYILTIHKLESLLTTSPRNQQLLFCLIEIYVKQKKEDVPKILYLLNRLKAQNLSFPIRNSLEDLNLELEDMWSKTCKDSTEKLNYVNYFKYKEQTLKLKRLIQQEVALQTEFWGHLNDDYVNILRVITQAEVINRNRDKIESYWYRELQNLEKKYVNSSILYGLYLEIVQDLPYLGSSFIQAAYKQIVNKNPLHDEITNVFIGKSAMIVASIEPENAGKIIDASSSVKKLFDIDKGHLIGSNINVLLPTIMVQTHTKLVHNFHKKFKYDINSRFYSYAKSFSGKYFPVSICLRAIPSFKKGLNIVAYIQKQAKGSSVMIMDYHAKVVECSVDIQRLLNVEGICDSFDLKQICPDLIQVNYAFNAVYASENIDLLADDKKDLDEREPNSPNALKERSTSVISSPTDMLNTRGLLKQKTDYIEEGASFLYKMEELPGILDRKVQENNVQMMTREDAETLCNKFRGKKRLKFKIYSNPHSKRSEAIIFETQIEPLVFAGNIYKVIKINKTQQIKNEEQSSPVKLFAGNKKVVSSSLNNQNIKINKINEVSGGLYAKIDTSSAQKGEVETQTPREQSEGDQNRDVNKNLAKLDLQQLGNLSRRSKTNSVINSVRTVRDQARHLNNLFTNQKISRATKSAIITVFISVLIVIVSVCVDLAFSRKSLDSMDNAMELINLTNSRLFRLLAAWRGVLILYTRSVGLRSDTGNNVALLTTYRGVIKNSSIEMLTNNNKLRMIVDSFSNDFVTEKFFEKKISLWLPYENRTINNEKVDLFTANQIIYNKNLYVANFPRVAADLKNTSEVLFSLNNTANDYLIAVKESIDDVKEFFDQTYNNNVSLLKIVLLLENFAIIISFVSLGLLFKIIVTKHRNLFKAVSKIKKKHTDKRINKLKKFTEYLKKDAEDSIILFHKNKLPHVQENHLDKKNNITYGRNYSVKDLFWKMNKYLSFAVILMTLIIVLFWFSFNTSIQGFDHLSLISSQIVTTYHYGGHISSILSKFYYVLIFANQTSFKIINDLSENQLNISISILSEANKNLLLALETPEKSIKNSAIEDLLKNDLCKYVTPDNKAICNKNTNYNAYGLLGINYKYYTICGLPILNYLAKPTAARGKTLLDNIVTVLGDMHMISFDGYEALANLILMDFKTKIKEKEADSLTFFQYNLGVILTMTFLITIVVITKFREIDLAVRKILRLIPYQIIERNKVLMDYLSKTFPKELSNINNM